jgi:ATP-binding cassette subfamily F protein 3
VREGRAAKPPQRKEKRPPPKAARPRSNGGQALEAQIEQAEAALKALEEELADPAAWSSPERTAQSSRRHEAAKQAVDELYAKWEQAAS